MYWCVSAHGITGTQRLVTVVKGEKKVKLLRFSGEDDSWAELWNNIGYPGKRKWSRQREPTGLPI